MSNSHPPQLVHSTFKNLNDLLLYRAKTIPERRAYMFLYGKNQDKQSVSYQELLERIQLVARDLIEQGRQGDRVLLICQPSLEYIVALFACFYVGMIAVPIYPPRNKKHISRIRLIVKDAEASIALITTKLSKKIKILDDDLGITSLILIDHLSTRNTPAPLPYEHTTEDLALLQYTSGSTGDPKGVMLTHGNLLYNLKIIHQSLTTSSDDIGVSWLPPYHDLGLIGGILLPLYVGFPMILMAPETFLQTPVKWLKTISDYKATISPGPSFAYELCINKISDKDLKSLELSRWKIAVNGAEPIRHNVLEAFSLKFQSTGFKKSAFHPSYGLAESTLFVSGSNRRDIFSTLRLDSHELAQGRIKEVLQDSKNKFTTLVSSGKVARGQKLYICDNQSQMRCKNGELGEIWLQGASIGQGYWNDKIKTKAIFQAFEKHSNEGPFLRTGDLGFVKGGELYVTGRIKDLIIISGRNYYPQDIESVVSGNSPALRQGCCVAFSSDIENKEELVIVAEVERQYRKSNLDEIRKEMMVAVAHHIGLTLKYVVLISPASIPKTSSGKIQRRLTAHLFKEKKLSILKDKVQDTLAHEHSCFVNSVVRNDVELLKQWLRDYAEKRINSRLIDERRCIPPHIVLDFGEKGLLGMQISPKYGGLGLSTRETLDVMEQLCAIDSTLAFFVGLNNSLGIRPIQYFANQETRQKLLPLLAKGRMLASFALTEESAGSNPRGIKSTVRPLSSGDWILNGTKIWSGSSSWAGVITVIAKNTDISGMSAFAAQQGILGMEIGEEELTMGVRGMVQNSVHFKDALIPASALLGEAGAGMEVAQDAMTYARLGFGALGVGGMKRCAQIMYRYGKRRTIITGRLLDNPLYRFRLARINARIVALETFVYHIADRIDANKNIPQEAFIVCKILGSEFLYQSADELMQALGGRGYIETNYVAQLFRDARLTRIFEGPTETLQVYLGACLVNSFDQLKQFMISEFDAEDQVKELLDLTVAVSKQGDALAEVLGNRSSAYQWINHALGDVLVWALLKVALMPQKSPALSWVEKCYGEAFTRALKIKSLTKKQSFPEDLSATITKYTSDIGDVEQHLPGEKQLADDYLLRTNNLEATVQTTNQTDKSIDPHASGNEYLNIRTWLIDWVSKTMQIKHKKIDVNMPFAALGIDSIQATELSLDISESLDIDIDPTVAWEYPDIDQLAGYLAQIKD